jgi:hypothetical protein
MKVLWLTSNSAPDAADTTNEALLAGYGITAISGSTSTLYAAMATLAVRLIEWLKL